MDIEDILKKSREIWGEEKISLSGVVARMGTIFGDICRWERNAPRDSANHTDQELKKELGNMIFSTIKWADELGYDPKECINLAIEAQEKGRKALK